MGTLLGQLIPPCMKTYTSTPGNTAKLGSYSKQQQTDSKKLTIIGWD